MVIHFLWTGHSIFGILNADLRMLSQSFGAVRVYEEI
jgi:hypothetical protein